MAEEQTVVADVDLLDLLAESEATAAEHARKTVDHVKAIFSKKIKPANVLLLVTYTMQTVERIGGLSGPQKKELVMECLQTLVEEIPFDAEDRAAIQVAVSTLAPAIIDTLVAAAKGQYDFGKMAKEVHKKMKSCWARFCGGGSS